MISKETIREDLKNIRYYYARREVFENSEAEIGGMSFLPIIRKYNQAIREASPRLYDLYVSLYLLNHTQRELADKMGLTPEHVQVLHRGLIQYFLKYFHNFGS